MNSPQFITSITLFTALTSCCSWAQPASDTRSCEDPHTPCVLTIPNILKVTAYADTLTRSGNYLNSFKVDATNISRQGIRGYVVALTFRDRATRRTLSSHAQAMIMTLPGGTPRYLLPEETERSPKPISIADVPTTGFYYDLTLDLVIFSDNTHWGKADQRESKHLIRLLHTMDSLGANHIP